MLFCPEAFEPGSFAVVAYFLQSHMTHKNRPNISCRQFKKFIKKHKHGLMDVALDEIADPTLDFVNQQTHYFYELFNHFPYNTPLSSLALSLYLIVLIIAILV
jgi:hypothetical protein